MITHDRVGGVTRDDQQVGQGGLPRHADLAQGHRPDGCGNDVLWKPQNGFHRTWKSRTDREIPTFPQADDSLIKERSRKEG